MERKRSSACRASARLLDERREAVAVGRLQVFPVEVDAVVAHVPDQGDQVVDEAPAAVGRSQHRRRKIPAERHAGARRVRDRGEQVEVVAARGSDKVRVLLVLGRHAAVRLRVVPVEVDLVHGVRDGRRLE